MKNNNNKKKAKAKTEILMNKPVYLGISILELSKITMYGFQTQIMVKKQNCVLWIKLYCIHKNR